MMKKTSHDLACAVPQQLLTSATNDQSKMKATHDMTEERKRLYQQIERKRDQNLDSSDEEIQNLKKYANGFYINLLQKTYGKTLWEIPFSRWHSTPLVENLIN